MLPRLEAIPGLTVTENAPLSQYTRFALGGPARFLADASNEAALTGVLRLARETATPFALIGGGSNLVVSDAGFDGIVIRFTGSRITTGGNLVSAEGGAVLQDVVNASIAENLEGLHTMTRIPGWFGGAIYGNAGAYGHSMQEFVGAVRVLMHTPEGDDVRAFSNEDCRFRYRESIFKDLRRQGTVCVILHASLILKPSQDRNEMLEKTRDIQEIRDEKFPPTMHCAGSIFKNLILAELAEPVRAQVPDRVVREGKVASAFFLEQVGAKGMRQGGIEVALYHANLIYNTGTGTAREVREIVDKLKRLVEERFGLTLEEEVQYLGEV